MFQIRPAENTKEDICFIIESNKAIEGAEASLTKERLIKDILCKNPKAYIYIFELSKTPIGLIFFSNSYWASRGLILWISQLYVHENYRGRFFYKIKEWVFKLAKENGASRIAWGTITEAKRANRLWKAAGAFNINDGYQFWAKKVEN